MLLFIFYLFSHCTTKILCSSILNHFTGGYSILLACIDHIVLHLRILFIINVMPSDLHQFTKFVRIKYLVLLSCVFPQEQTSFLPKFSFLYFLHFPVAAHRIAFFNNSPSDNMTFRKILRCFFHHMFHSILSDFKFTILFR